MNKRDEKLLKFSKKKVLKKKPGRKCILTACDELSGNVKNQ